MSSISKISMIGLPLLLGVSELSKNEIRKDIRDIERFILAYDTDSDSSIKSEDILPSSYPVKPRKTPRIQNRYNSVDKTKDNVTDSEENKTNISEVIESLDLIRNIRATKTDVFQGEIERERLEVLYQSMDNAINDKTNKLIKNKKAQENYIQILQAIYSKMVTQTALYNKQNSMLYDVYITLQRRKQMIESLDRFTKILKNQLANKQSNNNVYILNINSNEIIIHLDQYIDTPFGIGQIDSINIDTNIITIRLSYGKMYSNIYDLLKWIDIDKKIDLSNDKSLIYKWKISKSINKPIEYKMLIRSLLTSTNQDDDDITDYDDDLSQSEDTSQIIANDVNDNIEKDNHVDSTSNFPLNNNVVSNQRHLIKKSLHNEIINDVVSYDDLTLAFVPPSSIPSLLIKDITIPINQKIDICKSALNSPEYLKLGSSGLLTWNGSLIDMRSSLKQGNKQAASLNYELDTIMNNARCYTMKRLKLMQETSIRRLNMFTRRVRHRHNLSNHGITLTQAVNPTNQSQKSSVAAITSTNIRSNNNVTNGVSYNEIDDYSNDKKDFNEFIQFDDSKPVVKRESIVVKDELHSVSVSPIKDMSLNQSDISTSQSTKKKPTSTNGRRGSNKLTEANVVSNDTLDPVALASLSSSVPRKGTKSNEKLNDSIPSEVNNSITSVCSSNGSNEEDTTSSSPAIQKRRGSNTVTTNVNKRVRKN